MNSKAYIATLVLLLGVVPPSLAVSSPQTYVNLELSLNKTTVGVLVEHISKQTGYEFSYDEALLDREIRDISVKMKNESIKNVLNRVFNNTGISYKIIDNRIFLKDNLKSKGENVVNNVLAVVQQGKKISGTILDDSGIPVIGANIVVKGTTNGTITDADGRFVLDNIPEGAILVVSYIGYLDQEIPVSGKSVLNINLKEDTQKLDEVVVVGYGVQKKANLTGSVSTVKYGQELENRPITDPSQALSGKVTGVWVSQNSGAPGSDGATIRVRGYGTLNNTDPLVLIDGVEGRMSELAPNDIASITVERCGICCYLRLTCCKRCCPDRDEERFGR